MPGPICFTVHPCDPAAWIDNPVACAYLWLIAAVLSTVVMIWAAPIIPVYKLPNLSRQPKQVISR